MIVVASIFGGLSPFCSCGVIPLIAALLAMGVPLSAVMAFWLASPVIDPSMFVLTTGVLGMEFAVAKTITAVALGLSGGFVTLLLTRQGAFANPIRPDAGISTCGASSLTRPGVINWKFWQESERQQKFVKEALSTTLFLFKWLALAFLLESLMISYIPAEWVSKAVGGGRICLCAVGNNRRGSCLP